jgi:hypothetical protein
MRSVKWSALLIVLGSSALGGFAVSHQASQPSPQVMLEVEMFGGFAYINEGGKLHVAYLKDVPDPKGGNSTTSIPQAIGPTVGGCHVKQLGTDLKLLSGEIVSPLPPDPDRMWDLKSAIVTFPGLASSTEILDAPGGPRPVDGPASPDVDDEWERDLRWLPRISSGQKGADYPNHRRIANWRGKVDGFVEIPRGVVRASHPSNHDLRWTLFEFKPRNPTWHPGHPFVHALTDRVTWRVAVPGNEVVIALQGATSAPPQIVVRPARGNRVQLKLIGRHAHGTPASLDIGTELDHFCAFYELLERQSVPRTPPPFRDRLTPFVKSQLFPLSSGPGQPSPGALCPGIRFEP